MANNLRRLADAFQHLAGTVNSHYPHIIASQLAQACRLCGPSNFNFGSSFHFADMELGSKVNDIENAATENETIEALVQRDIAQGSERLDSSPSRSLVRLKRVIEYVRVIFEKIIENEGSDSLVEPITIAYDQVFARYHGSNIRGVFAAVKNRIPTLSCILNTLNEDGTYLYLQSHT
ncbi:hypothetical protein TIFTF001_047329 [Ficus carica]|uniref:Glycolipid transfer protein domain-containing protein n=1 Tax=Ficus carica TaxID=3494 RepID=A0AA87YTR8_FICCA|nr:hypothetical protein TIFTF001_047329 [Ficus carica]